MYMLLFGQEMVADVVSLAVPREEIVGAVDESTKDDMVDRVNDVEDNEVSETRVVPLPKVLLTEKHVKSVL
jgi:hypothetical protein